MQSKIIAISLLIVLSSVGSIAHAKDGMLAFFAKKVGSSVIKIGEGIVKNKVSPPKEKQTKTIEGSNVIIVKGN